MSDETTNHNAASPSIHLERALTDLRDEFEPRPEELSFSSDGFTGRVVYEGSGVKKFTLCYPVQQSYVTSLDSYHIVKYGTELYGFSRTEIVPGKLSKNNKLNAFNSPRSPVSPTLARFLIKKVSSIDNKDIFPTAHDVLSSKLPPIEAKLKTSFSSVAVNGIRKLLKHGQAFIRLGLHAHQSMPFYRR